MRVHHDRQFHSHAFGEGARAPKPPFDPAAAGRPHYRL